MTAFLLIFSC